MTISNFEKKQDVGQDIAETHDFLEEIESSDEESLYLQYLALMEELEKKIEAEEAFSRLRAEMKRLGI